MASKIASGSTVQDSSSTTIDSPSINVQAGDSVVFFVKHEGANGTITPSVVGGTSSQTFESSVEVNHSNTDLNSQMFVIENANADSALVVRFTFNVSKPFRRAGFIQFRPAGGKQFSFVPSTQENSSQGTSTGPGATNLTTSTAAVLVLGVGEYNTVTYTPGLDWTEEVEPGNSIYMEYRIETSGGTFSPSCTCSGSMDWVANAVYLTEDNASSSFTLSVENASASLSGQTVVQDTLIAVAEATATLAGQTLTFVEGLGILVDESTLVLGGQDVTLLANANITLAVTESTLLLQGQDLPFQLATPWDETLLTLAGQDITLVAGVPVSLAVTEGTLALAGQDVAFFLDVDYALSVTEAALSLAGQDVAMSAVTSFVLDVEQGALLLTSQIINLSTPYVTNTARRDLRRITGLIRGR